MPRNALAVALSVQERREIRIRGRRPSATVDEKARLFESADVELRERTQRVAADQGAATYVDTELGAVAVNLAESLLTLASELREARTTDAAFAVVQTADKELDQWQRSRPREAERYGTISLPFGVELLKQGFYRT